MRCVLMTPFENVSHLRAQNGHKAAAHFRGSETDVALRLAHTCKLLRESVMCHQPIQQHTPPTDLSVIE